MPGAKDCDRVPAAPLLDYIDKLGGPSRLPGLGVWARAEKAQDGGNGDQETVDRDELEEQRHKRLCSALKRAKKEGHLSLFTADAICCDHLGVHPMHVYGPDWFDFGAEVTTANEKWVEQFVHDMDDINPERVREMRVLFDSEEAA